MNVKDALKSLPLFSSCSAEELECLASHVEIIPCNRYTEIYHEGAVSACVHVVVSGEVCLEKNRGEDEEPMRLTIIKAGEVFGLGEFMLPTYYTTATALTECKLVRITNDDFKNHFMAVKRVRENVLLALSHIARFLMFSLISGTGTRQLACYLWHCCHHDADECDGKYHIRSKMRQPDIASLLNMSREHVSRLFSKLQSEGVVDFNRGFPIVDKQWLNEEVTDQDLAEHIFYRDYPQ